MRLALLAACLFCLATLAGAAEDTAASMALSPDRPAALAPDRVYLSFGSRHLNIDPTQFGRAAWNEINPGVIFSWQDRGRLGFNYNLGVFQNSYADATAYLGAGNTWALGNGDWRVGWVLGLAHYGTNAALIRSQIGTSGWIVTGGAQLEYRNLFVQLQPAGPQRGGGQGAVLVTGLTFDLGGQTRTGRTAP